MNPEATGRPRRPRRRWRGAGLAVLAALALGACSPPRAYEAALVLADLASAKGESRLERTTAAPRREPVSYVVAGRRRAADLYRPADGGGAPLVLVPGAAEGGKDDPRLVAFAETLARARFTVLVPDIRSLRALHVSPSDVQDIADAVAFLSQQHAAGGAQVGVAAISYAAGPALLALLREETRRRVRFLVAIGGYYDLDAVVTFFTTGFHRTRPGAPWRHREPNAYGKWVFVRANAPRLDDARDRTTLMAMAQRKLRDLDADVSDLVAILGAEGRTVHDLLANRDPDRVPALIAALPRAVRADMAALNVSTRDLSGLDARLILVHGRDDPIIPAGESVALAEAAPPGLAAVYLADSLAHVELSAAGLGDVLVLWRAVYRLLSERDALVSGG